MTYSAEQIKNFRKESLLKDIELSKRSIKIVSKSKVADWMRIHLDRLDQLSKEK